MEDESKLKGGHAQAGNYYYRTRPRVSRFVHNTLFVFSVKAGGMRIVQHKNINSAADKISAAAADEANSVLKVSTR